MTDGGEDATPGAFVAFEGLDGAGTTTQVARAHAHVENETDRSPHSTAEPTDGPIGTRIRDCLEGRLEFGPDTLALLFAADRLDHLRSEVQPALADGDVVLMDRYALSSFAYQRVETDAEPSWLRTINERARAPDLTVFLDVPPSVCAERLAADRDDVERFEREETLAAVYEAYQTAIEVEREAGHDVRIVDGTQDEDAVAEAVVGHLDDVL